ncbi:MAG TPA: cache domain-containing protein, partial [Nitrospirota bacterium]|nr:cache domain-containing protein [Nitrospirota bacterium]
MANKGDRRLKWTDYLPLAVLVAVFMLSAALLFVQYFYNREQLNREFTQERVLTARFAASHLREFLEHERMALENVAGLVSLTGDLGEGKAALDLFLKTHKRSPKLFSFFVLDSRGRYMYSMPESLVDRYMQDLSEEDYFRKPAAAGGFYNAGARPDGRGGFELIISVPVYSGG